MVISGDDVCYSVVFGTLVGVFVFTVMWSELLMSSDISCPLWSSVPESGECVHISIEDCDVVYAVLYVSVSCFIVRVCAVFIYYRFISPFSDRVGLPTHNALFPGVLMKVLEQHFSTRCPS